MKGCYVSHQFDTGCLFVFSHKPPVVTEESLHPSIQPLSTPLAIMGHGEAGEKSPLTSGKRHTEEPMSFIQVPLAFP